MRHYDVASQFLRRESEILMDHTSMVKCGGFVSENGAEYKNVLDGFNDCFSLHIQRKQPIVQNA